MDYMVADFNGADEYYDGPGAEQWNDIAHIIAEMPLYMQPSDQRGKIGVPIFDPKATNAHLTGLSSRNGWRKVPVPSALTSFGVDWDAGKNGTLAEWQFSNYPFLWNNVIRTEAVVKGGVELPYVGTTDALLIVTKSGIFPSSNSTLYFEQAEAQLRVVTELDVFSTPIRLVGLSLPTFVTQAEVMWSAYEARYGRNPVTCDPVTLPVLWGRVESKYGARRAVFGPPL